MKLLFDENLSPRLAESLADLFPDSVHVRDVGLRGAIDEAVWAHARDHRFVIVTKDSDFQRFALTAGPPPKVVWIRLGNRATPDVERILQSSVSEIHRFAQNPETAILVLD